jgi:hypothetical protein
MHVVSMVQIPLTSVSVTRAVSSVHACCLRMSGILLSHTPAKFDAALERGLLLLQSAFM